MGSLSPSLITESSQDRDPAEESQLPAPLLIEGMDLVRYTPPSILPDGVRIFTGGPEAANPDGERSFVFFGDAAKGPTGPVLGIEVFESGGFHSFGVNMSTDEVLAMTSHLSNTNQRWSISPESGAEEIANFVLRTDTAPGQLDFTQGTDTAVIQYDVDNGAGVWEWVARSHLANAPFTSEGVEFAGIAGVLRLAPASDDGQDMLVWTEGGENYRLAAFELIDGVSMSAPVSRVSGRVQRVSQTEWDAAVDDIGPTGFQSAATWTARLLVIGLAALVFALLVREKAWKPLALLIFAFASGAILLHGWILLSYFWALSTIVLLLSKPRSQGTPPRETIP